jgi:hypothetical protein
MTAPVGPTPHSSCAAVIGQLVTINYHVLRELQHNSKFNVSSRERVLSLAVALEEANIEDLPQSSRELRDFLLTESSYRKENARKLLDDLLAVDPHLRACCVGPWGLARAIELLIPEALARLPYGWDEGGVEIAVARIMAALYQSHFGRVIFIRLYNFDADFLPFSNPAFNVEIVRLDGDAISELIGEETPYSILHDTKTGTCFLRFVGTEPSDEREAFSAAWTIAHGLLKVLRYVKYGVIDIDYGAVYYTPRWATQIRRQGLSFWGQPRKDKQKSFYTLTQAELPKLMAYAAAYEKLRPIIEDPQPKTLRLAGGLAGNFYEWHYRRQEIERDQKLIELVIALETLFSPGREGELRFRIAQRASMLLGKDSRDRKNLMRFFKLVYDARSQLVHSGISAFYPSDHTKSLVKDLKVLNDQQLSDLGDYVRQATLRMLALVWRGRQHREEVNALLDEAALDESIRARMLKESDIDLAIEELLNPPKPHKQTKD